MQCVLFVYDGFVESSTVRYLELVDRPSGTPGPENFALAETTLPPVDKGQVLVENRYLSVDPYMRGRMSTRPSYYPPWPLRSPLDGDAVGVVVASRAPDLPEGEWVASEFGLRDRFVASRRRSGVFVPCRQTSTPHATSTSSAAPGSRRIWGSKLSTEAWSLCLRDDGRRLSRQRRGSAMRTRRREGDRQHEHRGEGADCGRALRV